MRWVHGWPVILGPDQIVPRFVKRPKLPAQAVVAQPMTGPLEWNADFTREQLPYALNTLRTPTSKWWSVDTGQGALFLEPRPEDLDSKHDPSLIAHRQQHARFSSSVQMQLGEDDRPSDAGLVVFQNEAHSFFLGVHLSPEGVRTVFLEKRNMDVSQVASANLPANTHEISLKAQGAGAVYTFFYRAGTGAWIQLGADQDGTILSTKKAGGFVGAYIGMFARKTDTLK